MRRIIDKLRHDVLFIVTSILVLIAAAFHRVDWFSISWPTVESLLALLGLVTLFQSLGFIDALADFFIEKAKTTQALVRALFLLTFCSAMIVTNDVAILTFIPLTFALAKKVALPTVKVAVLTTVYANLGSDVSPLGNPQNIYLLAHYKPSALDMLFPAFPLFTFGILSLFAFSLTIPKTAIKAIEQKSTVRPLSSVDKVILAITSLAVLICLSGQMALPATILLVFVLILAYDFASLKEVDYGVVLSIINFFLLVSVLIGFPAVHKWLLMLGQSQITLFLTGVFSSQIISNVPAAALFAPITPHFSALYLAVSIGGFGTLVASLANLLAFRQVKANAVATVRRDFLIVFVKYNLFFLVLGIAIGLTYLVITN